jgi:aspartyl protease family protein
LRRLVAAWLLAALPPHAAATSVMVMSISAGRVELLVNGSAVRSLRAGGVSPEGVRVIEVGNGAAVVEVDGRRWQMRLGSSTASSAALRADARGHFFVDALVNGVPVRSIVDTGATSVALNLSDARRLGVDLNRARRAVAQTAGGPRVIWIVQLASVQVGDIVLAGVQAALHEANELPVALLGMSFLGQVDMQRSGDTLILTRRH